MRRRNDGEPASTYALICAVLGLLVLWPLIIVAMILAAPHRRYNGNARTAWALSVAGLVVCAFFLAILVAFAVLK